MSNLIRLLRYREVSGALWLTLGSGARLVMSAAYVFIVASALGASDFGILAGTLALVTALAPFAGWGSGNILLMRTARDRTAYPQAAWRAITTISAGTLLFGIVGWQLLAPMILGKAYDAVLVAALLATELFLFRTAELAGQAFQAHDRLSTTALIQATIGGLKLVSALCFLAFGTLTLTAWITWYVMAGALSALFAVTLAGFALGMPKVCNPIRLDDLRNGFFFSLGISSKTIYSDIDKTMLLRLDTPSTAGVYTVAYRFMTALFTPIQAAIVSANTRIFQHGEAGVGSAYRYARRLVPPLAAMSVLASAALFFGSPLVPLLMGHEYRSAATVLRWLSLMPMIQAAYFLLGDVLMGAGLQSIRSTAQLLTATVNIALNIILIPAISWRGAVLATYVSEFLLLLVILAVVRSKTK